LFSQLLEDRVERAARDAPLSPKVDYDGLLSGMLQNFVLEVVLIDFDNKLRRGHAYWMLGILPELPQRNVKMLAATVCGVQFDGWAARMLRYSRCFVICSTHLFFASGHDPGLAHCNHSFFVLKQH
jgi:hypothetical protein